MQKKKMKQIKLDKMKTLKQALLLVFLIAASTLFAQNSGQKILDELAKKTNASKSIKVGFSYEMTNIEADINEKTEGTLLVAGNKYHLNIAGQEIICDGTTSWTYIAEANEVQINEVDKEESFSPNKLLSSYSDDYDAALEKEYTENGKVFYLLKLKPKAKNSSFNYVLLKVDKAKMQLESFVMYDFDNNVFSYKIKEYLSNLLLPENAFKFNSAKYPKAEIIDMR
jgi:outer membrane lipoprotein-sorting protein